MEWGGLGNGGNAARVCVWAAAGGSSRLPPTLLLFKGGPGQTTTAGVAEVVLGERRWRERAGLELRVLSRDLPWRALRSRGEQDVHYLLTVDCWYVTSHRSSSDGERREVQYVAGSISLLLSAKEIMRPRHDMIL